MKTCVVAVCLTLCWSHPGLFSLASFRREAGSMAEREERRFAEVSRESVKLMAESVGVELGDDVAARLAEDVCYRLREAAQVSAAAAHVITVRLNGSCLKSADNGLVLLFGG